MNIEKEETNTNPNKSNEIMNSYEIKRNLRKYTEVSGDPMKSKDM